MFNPFKKKEPVKVEEPVKQEVQPETVEQINWKKFREQREIERKANEEAIKRANEKEAEASALKLAMEAILNKPSNNARNHDSQNDDSEESEDQRIQKKVDAALSIRERQLDEERRKREQAEYPQKLVSAYKDFNQVCSAENLDYLEFHYPEVAVGFKHMPDGFDKWASIYQAVKRFMPNSNIKKEQQQIEKNVTKPQSMSAPGVTSTGDTAPIQLDDKRRADNWNRMMRTIKGQ